MKKKLLVLGLCLVLLFALFPFLAGPSSIEARPSNQQGQETIWRDQQVTTSGLTATVNTGPVDKVTFFLHVDAPPAQETVTIKWLGKAEVGDNTYRAAVYGADDNITDFTTAQDYITYTITSDGKLFPRYEFALWPNTGTITVSLFKVQK